MAEKDSMNLVSTASAILEDGSIIELLHQPETRRTLFAVHNAGRWSLLDHFDLNDKVRLVPFRREPALGAQGRPPR
jgi:hypothetical protein